MEQSPHSEVKPTNSFPFNNLFLIKGYVTGKNSFWMYLVGICATILGYSLVQYITLYPLISVANEHGITITKDNLAILYNPDAIGLNRSLMLAIVSGSFVLALLFLWLVLKYVHGKTMSSIITGFEKIRWKRYFFSFTLWSILTIVYVAIYYFSTPNNFELRFNAGNFFILLIVSILFIPIQSATEELFLRSYLLQGLSQIFKNGIVPLILTSILFGLLHSANPETQAHGYLIMMPYYICFGAFLGILTLLDEGAELAMGIHFANNLVLSLLVCSQNSVLKTDSIYFLKTENPGIESLGSLVMACICFFILFKKYKLSNWKLLIR